MKNLLKVLTANRLSDGVAVWFAQPEQWVDDIAKAYAVSDKEGVAFLEQVVAATLAKGQHCDVVLIDVEQTNEGPRPLKLRERIRADGPTIRPDLGSRAA